MSVDTRDIRSLERDGSINLSADNRDLLRSAADELDELRENVEAVTLVARHNWDTLVSERAAHEATKRGLDELNARLAASADVYYASRAKHAEMEAELEESERIRDRLHDDLESQQEALEERCKQLETERARRESAERALRAVNSADHGLECTVDHDSERGEQLCPKRMCLDHLARYPRETEET